MADLPSGGDSHPQVRFTRRQLEILRVWEATPQTTKVADALGLSYHTVNTHLRRMRRKLQVRRTVEVYRYVKEWGGLEENS